MTPVDEVAAALESRLPGRVERDAPSAALTTYRCGGPLDVLVRALADEDVVAVGEALRGSDVPVLVVGRGSNLLVADRGFRGVALLLGGTFEDLALDPRASTVRAGAAVALPVLARRSAAAGLGGLEFYVGIPGSVGGAVRMNAGGQGTDTAAVIREARVADLATGEIRRRAPESLGLGYRTSGLGPGEVVVGAEFAARPDSPAACEARVAEHVRWRREHQPGGSNAGSVFVNPTGDHAGRLVDACGLKGLRVGAAVVSSKHANFIVAEAGATAADVHELIGEVRRRVLEQTGVELRTELRLVGFDDAVEGLAERRGGR